MPRKSSNAATDGEAAPARRSGRIAAIPAVVQDTAKKVVKKATGKKRTADAEGEGEAGVSKKVCYDFVCSCDGS